MNELISIITPVYNAERYLKETIDSVLQQTYKNWELILVNDCSKDSSVSIIQDYIQKDNRIKIIDLENNVGAAKARQIGVDNALGKFIAFIDSDDIWYDNKLMLQLELMNEKDAPFSFTSYEIINENGELVNKTIKALPVLSLNKFLKNKVIGFSTTMYNIEKIGKLIFPELRLHEDLQFLIRLFKKGNIAYGLEEVMVKYRVHSQSLSSNKIKAAKQVWKIYFNFEKLGLFKSIYYFACYAFESIKRKIT